MKNLLILPFTVFLVASAGCPTKLPPAVASTATCAAAPLVAQWPTLLATVTAILSGGQPNWQEQLKALETMGEQIVVCAVMAVMSPETDTPSHTRPDAAMGERASQYLATKAH